VRQHEAKAGDVEMSLVQFAKYAFWNALTILALVAIAIPFILRVASSIW
jgi:hypothetical protein